MIIDRIATISFFAGLLAGDLFFRLSEQDAFMAALLISIIAAAAVFTLRMFSDKIPMFVAMFPAGFAISSALKWLLLS